MIINKGRYYNNKVILDTNKMVIYARDILNNKKYFINQRQL